MEMKLGQARAGVGAGELTWGLVTEKKKKGVKSGPLNLSDLPLVIHKESKSKETQYR